MDDNSFLYFTKDEVISKIDIDDRLIPIFKKVLIKLQEYFNLKGYTTERNYREYLEKYLLNSGSKNIKIYIGPTNGCAGFFSKYEHKICINEKIIDSGEDIIEHVLCHEFIHFLVMHGLIKGKSDPQIYNGGPINEALTELLTMQMYSYIGSYDAQVKMHTFANEVSGNKDNFSLFLRGSVDARYASSNWLNYENEFNTYQDDYDKDISLMDVDNASKNKHYVNSQRYLIELFINPLSITTFEQYCDAINKLSKRPVEDKEYIDEYIEKIDNYFIRNLGIKDEYVVSILKIKLKEVREKMSCNIYKHEIEFVNRKITIVKKGDKISLEGNLLGITRSILGNDKVILRYKNETLTIKVSELYLKNEYEKNGISDELLEYSKLFSKDNKNLLDLLSIACSQNGTLQKIVKVMIPVVGKKKTDVFVAVFSNKIVVLDDMVRISNISNISLNKYLGLTSHDEEKSAIYQEPIGTSDEGVLYSTLSERQIENKIILILEDEIERTISKEELDRLMEEYKKNNPDVDEDIKYFAINSLAQSRYQEMSSLKRKKYIDRVIKENNSFIVTTLNHEVLVGDIHGREALVGESEVIYDSKKENIYTSIVNYLMVPTTEHDFIPTMLNGDIINVERVARKIEQLFNIRITPISNEWIIGEDGIPIAVMKDRFSLANEQRELNKKINELYEENKIDRKTYNLMKQVIFMIYSEMIKNAPKNEKIKDNQTRKK